MQSKKGLKKKLGYMPLNKPSPFRIRLILNRCSSSCIEDGLIHPELFGPEDEFLQLSVYD